MKVSSTGEMRRLDQRAIGECGIPAHVLMENAGHAVYFAILQEFGIRHQRFAVICGLGHNGGDGLVIGRKLHSSGGLVEVVVLGDPAKYDETCRLHYDMLSKVGVDIAIQPSIDTIAQTIQRSDAVVDALLGTGLTREVGGRYRQVVECINSSGKRVFSVDIPSGVDGDSGQVRGIAVQADTTVTFGLPKLGNLLYPGAEFGGRLYVTHISFPPWLQDSDSIKVHLEAPTPLPPRQVDGHKGTFGDALFIAGSANYYGAPSFAARSFLKAGGGYARLATPRSMVASIAALGSEIVFVPQQETDSGGLSLGNLEPLVELSRRVDFVVMGPGLSREDDSQNLVLRLAEEIEKPVLIDGDGLTAVAQDLGILARRKHPTILTPHPGEMSRLCGKDISEIQTDPIGVIQQMTAQTGSIIVLKIAHSLIGFPDGRVFLNPSGNSGMASAGSGDVLTGTIVAMYGLGLPIEKAVTTGVFMHGLAGDLAAEAKGEDGMTAGDVLDFLPLATRRYREAYADLTRNFYGLVRVI